MFSQTSQNTIAIISNGRAIYRIALIQIIPSRSIIYMQLMAVMQLLPFIDDHFNHTVDPPVSSLAPGAVFHHRHLFGKKCSENHTHGHASLNKCVNVSHGLKPQFLEFYGNLNNATSKSILIYFKKCHSVCVCQEIAPRFTHNKIQDSSDTKVTLNLQGEILNVANFGQMIISSLI